MIIAENKSKKLLIDGKRTLDNFTIAIEWDEETNEVIGAQPVGIWMKFNPDFAVVSRANAKRRFRYFNNEIVEI